MQDKESIWIESYRRDRRQAAERQRLLREVFADTKADLSLYERALLWVSHYLILWGVALHNRYGEMLSLHLDRKVQETCQ